MTEAPQEYTTDALEMMGQGYEQPAAIIDPSRMVKALRDGGIVDYKVWGWVKTSARFRSHIKILRGAKHDIWHYLALGVGEDGRCKETIKQICEGTGYSHTEVINSLKELDELGYLSIQKDSKGNIYTPEFVARGGNSPTESAVKKVESTPVYQVESTPSEVKSISSYKELKELIRKPDILDGEIHFKLKPESVRKAIKKYFRINVDWDTKLAHQWVEWAVKEEITAEQISRASEAWKTNKLFNWQPPTLKGIFEKWDMLMDEAKIKPAPKTYNPAAEVEPEYVPAPPRKK